MKRILSLCFLIALIAGTVFILSSSKYYTNEGRIFGTSYHIKYAGTKDLGADIEAELRRVNQSMSMFDEGSTLSRFNNNRPFPQDAMFTEVLRLSQQIAEETHGAFDITVAPLVNTWGFGFKNKSNVTPEVIDSILTFVGYEKLQVKGNTFTKQDPRLAIDMGAVAKGYGVDRIARLLESKGCKNYMVEIGGEVFVKGENPEGKRWSLGINKPVDDPTHTANEIQTVLHITNRGIATSGNYRNFYYKGGKKYAHTINPKTGYPVEHSLLSATVIAPTCAQADAYATSFMVMGLEAARQFVGQHKDLQTYLIYADPQGQLRTWMSDGMSKYIQP